MTTTCYILNFKHLRMEVLEKKMFEYFPMYFMVKAQDPMGHTYTRYKKHSGTKLGQFQPKILEISSFRVYAIFSNGPWRPSWIVNLHKFEIVPLKIKTASYKKHSGTKLDQFHPIVLEILSFSCLCNF